MNERSNLAAAREGLRRALEGTQDSDANLAAAADEMLKATETFTGECQKAVPFAQTFLVIDPVKGGVWRCTHRPVHEVPL